MKEDITSEIKDISIGTTVKDKKKLEEQHNKEEKLVSAHVFQEFVEIFEEKVENDISKVRVKDGTYDAGTRKEDAKNRENLYKPQSRILALLEVPSSAEQAQAYAELLAADKKPDWLGKVYR